MRRSGVFIPTGILLAVLVTFSSGVEEGNLHSEEHSYPIILDADFDDERDFGPGIRGERAVYAHGQGGYRGRLGYYQCSAPEGLTGSCKPLATCAQYYSTQIHYDYNKPSNYKSCTFGYGYRGICCPDVYYQGYKPWILKPEPYRYGYDGHYTPVSEEAIEKAVDYAYNYMNKYYRHDSHLGRGEDDASYWGNLIPKSTYNDKFKDYADTGYFIACMTEYLQKYYGYNPYSYVDGGLKLIDYSHLLPYKYQQICHSYYKKCYPSKYRSFDGSCNNLQHPYYGVANSALGHIRFPTYTDRIFRVRYHGHDGSSLPQARHIRHQALPDRTVDENGVNNLYVHYGQMVTHDVSHVMQYQAESGEFIDCCYGYNGGEQQVSPKCLAIPIPSDDTFYHKHKQTCLNMARAMLAPNYNCAAGYGSALNHQTAYLDMSLTYGTNKNESESLRTHKKGYMKMSKVGYEYVLPNDNDTECFNVSKDYCPKTGDYRSNIHPGMQGIQLLAVRFHNYCAKKLYKLNPYWDDEKLFQECRRITIAVYQHITYTEYLPLLLGWRFMYDYGLLPASQGYSYNYREDVIPWTLTEFSGAAFRLHSEVYGSIPLVDEYYRVTKLLSLKDFYNNAMLYTKPEDIDKIMRGYFYSTKRSVDPYYDNEITDYLLMDHGKTDFGLDLPTMNMQRGRDLSLGKYNDYREICGLPAAYKWEDLYDTMDRVDIERLSKIYKSPVDLELYPGGLTELHVKDSLLGPVWWCIVGYQFQLWKNGDRYFYDLGGFPHSFSLPQLNEIRQMSIASLLCITTGLHEVPTFGFRTIGPSNPLVSCKNYEDLPRLNFGPWASKY